MPYADVETGRRSLTSGETTSALNPSAYPNTQGMAIATDGKLILSSSDDGRICAWGMRNGEFITGEDEECPTNEQDLKPLATYESPEAKYIELDPTDSWVVDVRDRIRASVWTLKPDKKK